MDKNPLLKYVMKARKEDVIHSSAYAAAQSGGAVGAASAQSFEERRMMEQNRTRVRAYGDSQVAQGARSFGPHPKAYGPSTGGNVGARGHEHSDAGMRGYGRGDASAQGYGSGDAGARAYGAGASKRAEMTNARALHSAGGALGGMRRAASTPATHRAFTPPVRRPFGK